MSTRFPRFMFLPVGVAATIVAATLGGAGCQARPASSAEEFEAAESSIEPVVIETSWLIAPHESLEPPLAAPLAIEVDVERHRLLLLETQPAELRVHDLGTGRFIETLGREGDGPGEYRHPIDMAVGDDGSIAVLSMGGRITYWSAAAELSGTVVVGHGMSTDIVAGRADSFIVKTDVFPPADVAEFRVTARDTVLGPVLFRDENVAGIEEPGRGVRNHSYAVATTPEGDLLLSPPGPDYLILRIGPDGRLFQTMGRPDLGPLRRDENEMAALRKRVREKYTALGRVPPGNLRIPMNKSHVAGLAVGPDATVWALTHRGDEETAIIDCFAADGDFVASYAVKLRVYGLAVSSDSIYLLARSSLDVPGVAAARRPDSCSRKPVLGHD